MADEELRSYKTLADASRPFVPPASTGAEGVAGHRPPTMAAVAAAGASVPPSAAGLLNPLMELAARLQYHRQMELFYEDCHRREKMLVETQAEELRLRQMWLEQELLKEKQLEEQKRLEQERIEQIKSKPKERESANASDEVKQVLRTAIIKRAKRGNGQHVMWARTSSHDGGGVGDCSSPGMAVGGQGGTKVSPPLYRSDVLGRRHEAEFPIRKTVSEPNLKVKAALRQKLAAAERRGSPLAAGRTMSHQQQLPSRALTSHQPEYSTQLTVDTGTGDTMAAAAAAACGSSSTPPLLEDSRRRLLTLASYGSMASLRHEEGLLRQMKQQLPAEYMHISLPNIPLATLPPMSLREASGKLVDGAGGSAIAAQRAAAGGSTKSLSSCPDTAAAAAMAESFAQQQQHAAAAAALLSALGPSLSAVAAATVGAAPGRILHPAFQPSFPGLQEEDYHLHHQLPPPAAPPTGGSGSLVHDARLLAHPYLGGKSSLALASAAAAVGDGSAIGPGGISTAAQQALQRHLQQRHHQQHKPIVRTHSAPLPIHHPAAAVAAAVATGQPASAGGGQQPILLEHQRLMKRHQEQYIKEQQKKMVIGQLRQTILQRSGSRSHMEHVSEEAEARLAMEMQESREDGNESQELTQQQWLQRQQIVQQRALASCGSTAGATGRRLAAPPAAAAGSEQQLLGGSQGDGREPNGDTFATLASPLGGGAGTGSTLPPPLPPPGLGVQHRLSRARSSPLVTASSGVPGRVLLSANGSNGSGLMLPAAAPTAPERPTAAAACRSVPVAMAAPVALAAVARNAGGGATGLAYDESMLRHSCVCSGGDDVHLESPSRLLSIWQRLTACGLAGRCERVDSKKATMEQLQLCHAESYSLFFGVNSANRKRYDLNIASGFEFTRLPCGGLGVDADTVWNEEYSAHAARVAAGCVLELAGRVTSGSLLNGMAIVRPPGHHAEHSQAVGFCYFNSIAIAAKWMKATYNLKRILIVDWDVHHGNGTQQMTYDDPHILYLSLHRHDDGNFFPGTGAPADCGQGPGLGYNVNIAFSGSLNPPMGDAEYLAAFRCLVLPIASDYKPELILVSAGFDAADGHAAPLGGYKVSASCFGLMTQQLMTVADSKVVLVLEGGYDLGAICDASEACVRALLGEQISLPNHEEISKKPCEAALTSLAECIRVQARFWPSVVRHSHKLAMSYIESLHSDREATETVSSAMASLSMAAAVAAARNGMTTLCDMSADATAAEEAEDCSLPPAQPPSTLSTAEPMDQV